MQKYVVVLVFSVSLLSAMHESKSVRGRHYHDIAEIMVGQEEPVIGATGAKRHVGKVLSLAYNKDASMLASGSDDKMVCIWRNEQTHCIPFDDNIEVIALDDSGNTLAFGKWNGACIVDTTCQQTRNTFDVPYPYSIALSGDGKKCVVGTEMEGAYLYDLTSGKEIGFYERTHDNPAISAVALNDNGNELLIGSWNEYTALWDLRMNQRLKEFRHRSRVTGVGFARDKVITRDRDYLCIWERKTGERLVNLSVCGGEGTRGAVASSDDGTHVMNMQEGTGTLWNTQTNRKLLAFAASSVRSSAVSRDMTRAATGDGYGCIKVWNISSDRQRALQKQVDELSDAQYILLKKLDRLIIQIGKRFITDVSPEEWNTFESLPDSLKRVLYKHVKQFIGPRIRREPRNFQQAGQTSRFEYPDSD